MEAKQPGSAADALMETARSDSDPEREPDHAPAIAGSAPGLEPGGRIDRFVILKHLGAGGMGIVVAAYDERLDRRVAIKVLRPDRFGRLGDTVARQRLIQEARAMARLAHPNVVTVHEVGELADHVVFLVMELVTGVTLGAWLRDDARTLPEILDVFLSAGQGLAAAHTAGVIHRDFKPDNVLVGDDGRVRVTDFGIARSGTEASVVPRRDFAPPNTPFSAITETGEVMGTPLYMAPEQHLGQPADARADQFSFCVALYAALYRQSPFPATSAWELFEAVTTGKVLPPPGDVTVPEPLRQALLRGMQLEPDRRFPAMAELLRALQPPTPKRTRVYIAGGAALVVAAAGLLLLARGSGHRAEPCVVGEDALAGITDAPQQAKIRAAFTAADPLGGAGAYARVHGVLDRFAGAWLTMRRQACEATRVRGEQSEALLDLRMMCLDRRRGELRALTDGLATADAPTVTGAMRAALGLTPVADCGDAAALTAPLSPPGPQVRDLVEAQRIALAQAKALRLLGHNDAALAQVTAVVTRAKALAYPPLEAEALLEQGDLTDRTGDSAAAIKILQQAIVAADAGRHLFVAAQAWSTLAWIQGYETRELAQADLAIQMAGAAITALGGNAELSAQLTNYAGLVLDTRGQLAAAKAKYLEALAARERMGEQDDWKIALVLNDLGGVERRLGDYDAARTHHERALAIRRHLFGEQHPYVFSSLTNLGNVAWSQDKYAEAEAYFRSALTVGAAIYPENHPQIALGLINLGSALEDEGKAAEAVEAFRRVAKIYEATRGPTHPDVADALHSLGNALSDLHSDDEAMRTYERALAIVDAATDADADSVSRLLSDFAELLRRRKDDARAERLLLRAVAIDEKGQGDAAEIGYPLTVLGELYATSGRAVAARQSLERALTAREAPSVHPAARARTELALATLLWDVPADRARALELARAAKSRQPHDTPPGREAYDAITRWLAAHE